ncbi:carboxy terminal motor kinesin [Salpingoeca rosetta]|uniref:Kinesin-like protein n=1 Tax=Salpingoeca rosetta (strain ATCC 50818 / BSB-021) TaxID=946362 RepID=F2U9Y8_SALR5|nr:carboxy terminal motor kinesin [Salpingoeca rosetta]EGD73563.1 carboxy terminal motor kinesin [Salpingoeca rosetta]|eukprot:XP_004993845.1 carboxy terminal motor kinesin [Salpingoeca rosetta]
MQLREQHDFASEQSLDLAPVNRKAYSNGESAARSSATTTSRFGGAGAKAAKTTDKPKSKAALKIEELEQECTRKDEAFAHQKQAFEQEKDTLKAENEQLATTCTELKSDVDQKQAAIVELRETVDDLQGKQSSLLQELDGLRSHLSHATSTIEQQTSEIKDLHDKVAALEACVKEHEQQAIVDEAERRRLHNMVQELKGNVRVFCRVRPFLSGEDASADEQPVACLDGKTNTLASCACSANVFSSIKLTVHPSAMVLCSWQVFDRDSTQAQVFEEIEQLVQSSMDGYNVCVFAYGQTGSGKTYTMLGGDDEGSRGMIPRAVEQLFQRQAELAAKGWEYTFKASMLEIYNEEPRDLLATPGSATKPVISWTAPVSNLSEFAVTVPDDVHELLQRAETNRRTAKTAMNARSSRSHSVFRLQIAGENKAAGEVCNATLNLIDLAGSERIKVSKVQGKEEKEAKYINKSLTTLKRVFTKLSQKDGHVPFRDSKLTMLLKDSMCNNSKCLMFVNVAPTAASASETKNSLRFAAEANKCHLGTARANSGTSSK